ncbi:MAG TPA: hypothetical protein VN918_05360, partial [Myxococcaceae bacterium]|nr:hypothetical protein [Myxococcaceae bacterium]
VERDRLFWLDDGYGFLGNGDYRKWLHDGYRIEWHRIEWHRDLWQWDEWQWDDRSIDRNRLRVDFRNGQLDHQSQHRERYGHRNELGQYVWQHESQYPQDTTERRVTLGQTETCMRTPAGSSNARLAAFET